MKTRNRLVSNSSSASFILVWRSKVDTAISFDDAFLYEELTKPIRKRKIPMEQLLQDEALSVFQEWQKKEDRIQY